MKHLVEYLGVPQYSKDKYQGNDYAGVVTGLAWTAVGGILFVESSLSRGKGSKLTLTGNLGDVMKESAMLAMEYIHSHTEELNIDPEISSTGTRIFTCPKAFPRTVLRPDHDDYLWHPSTRNESAQERGHDRRNYLRGKVLPVGGIEKILAAKRAGIKDIICARITRKM